MKKILFGLLICISCTSCTNKQNLTEHNSVISILEVKDVTIKGESHEYIYFKSGYGTSLSHWEGCKYCKNK